MGRKHCGKRRNCSLRAIPPFPSVFKRLVSQGRQKVSLCGNGLMHHQQTAFENIVGKEEIARKEQFLLFPQRFLLNQKIVSPFANIFDIISLFTAELEEPKMGL